MPSGHEGRLFAQIYIVSEIIYMLNNKSIWKCPQLWLDSNSDNINTKEDMLYERLRFYDWAPLVDLCGA